MERLRVEGSMIDADIIPFAPPNERIPLPSYGMVARIQNLVANSYGVDQTSMRSPSRNRDDAWPRQVAMYLARKITGKSFPNIGREFGNRDHSTVMFAMQAVEKRMDADPIYRGDVEALRAALR